MLFFIDSLTSLEIHVDLLMNLLYIAGFMGNIFTFINKLLLLFILHKDYQHFITAGNMTAEHSCVFPR